MCGNMELLDSRSLKISLTFTSIMRLQICRLFVNASVIFYSSRFLGVIVCVGFLLMSCIVSGTLSSVHNYPLGVFGGGGDPR